MSPPLTPSQVTKVEIIEEQVSLDITLGTLIRPELATATGSSIDGDGTVDNPLVVDSSVLSDISSRLQTVATGSSVDGDGTIGDPLVVDSSVLSDISSRLQTVATGSSIDGDGTVGDPLVIDSSVLADISSRLQVSLTSTSVDNLIQYDGTNWVNVSGINAALINAGTLANARISESNVKQHEAALVVNWTQISGTPAIPPSSDPDNVLVAGSDGRVYYAGINISAYPTLP